MLIIDEFKKLYNNKKMTEKEIIKEILDNSEVVCSKEKEELRRYLSLQEVVVKIKNKELYVKFKKYILPKGMTLKDLDLKYSLNSFKVVIPQVKIKDC